MLETNISGDEKDISIRTAATKLVLPEEVKLHLLVKLLHLANVCTVR